jgi:hypothetical protein
MMVLEYEGYSNLGNGIDLRRCELAKRERRGSMVKVRVNEKSEGEGGSGRTSWLSHLYDRMISLLALAVYQEGLSSHGPCTYKHFVCTQRPLRCCICA